VSTPGGPFEDKVVDETLFRYDYRWPVETKIRVVDDGRDINDASFAKDVAESMAKMLGLQEGE